MTFANVVLNEFVVMYVYVVFAGCWYLVCFRFSFFLTLSHVMLVLTVYRSQSQWKNSKLAPSSHLCHVFKQHKLLFFAYLQYVPLTLVVWIMKPSSSSSTTPKKRKLLEKVLSNTKSIIDYFSPSASISPKKNDHNNSKNNISGTKLEMYSPNTCETVISMNGESSVKKRRLDLDPGSNDLHDSKLELGLVRVDSPGITLQELTDFFSSLQKKESDYHIYPLFPGAILGRNVSSTTSSIPGKVPIDIDKSENGVSRKQIKVEEIINSNIKHQHSNNRRLNSYKSQMDFVDEIQSSMPSVKISCAPDAVNPILVCKVRCNHKYLKGKTKGKGLALRNQVDVLHKGNSVILQVGDAIEFDLYNRRKDVNGGKANYVNAQDSGKYVYRLVGYERNENDVSLVQSLRCAADNQVNKVDPPITAINIDDISMSTSGMKHDIALEGKDSIKSGKPSNMAQKPPPLDVTTETTETSVEVTPDPTPTSSEAISKHEKISSCDIIDYVPQVGDLFRIGMFDKDLFSSKKSLKWFIGTSMSVKPKGKGGKYILNFQFQDSETCSEEFPHECVVPIEKKQGSTYRTACYKESGLFALDTNPAELALGDFVECRFQDGAYDGKWWYGRVAAINKDEKIVDVAYFDGNVSCITFLSYFFANQPYLISHAYQTYLISV